MQSTSLPHVTKHETESGREDVYYAPILIGKKNPQSMEHQVQESSLWAPFSQAQEVILHFYEVSTGPNTH